MTNGMDGAKVWGGIVETLFPGEQPSGDSFGGVPSERDRSDIDRDTMSVVKWLEGSYPNFFFSVAHSEIDTFTERCAAIRSHEDYEKFVDLYGVRRTNPVFWEIADWFQDEYMHNQPVSSGLFDLNRYQNR